MLVVCSKVDLFVLGTINLMCELQCVVKSEKTGTFSISVIYLSKRLLQKIGMTD